jgi:RHS repeat-associated protein
MSKLLITMTAGICFFTAKPASARYYEPSTARFLQEDPILLPMPSFSGSQNLSDSQSLNRYIYVGNRPFNYTDPLGLYWYDDVGDASAGFGDAVSFGLTKNVRGVLSDYLDMKDSVDPCSGYYTAGKWTGYAWWVAFGSISAGGVINNNRYLRIGPGRKGGEKVFRIGGKWLKEVTGKPHLDLWRLGPL